MMDRRWSYILSDAAHAAKHLSHAIELYARTPFSSAEADYLDSMAFMHMMQSGHTSAESALRRVLSFMSLEVPIGPDSHARLIDLCATPVASDRPALISSDLGEALRETRRFRHVAMHTYDHLDRDKARFAVEAAKVVVSRLEREIVAFRALCKSSDDDAG